MALNWGPAPIRQNMVFHTTKLREFLISFSQTKPRFWNNFSKGLLYFIVKFCVLNARGDAWRILEAGQRD